MGTSDVAPPAWARTIFYILILFIIIMCVATFVWKVSLLSGDLAVQEAIHAIVALCIGLSVICGIIWVGAIIGLTTVSQAVQKALWGIFIVAILSATVVTYKDFIGTPEVFSVTGVVKKQDNKNPNDIVIITRFPPFYPTPSTGNNVSVSVGKDSDGRLPMLAFTHPAYLTEPIDLNDRGKVALEQDQLTILTPVELKPNPPRTNHLDER